MNISFCGKRAFAHLIKILEMGEIILVIQVVLKVIICVFTRGRWGRFGYRGGKNTVKTKADVRVMWPKPKNLGNLRS